MYAKPQKQKKKKKSKDKPKNYLLNRNARNLTGHKSKQINQSNQNIHINYNEILLSYQFKD